MNSNSPSQNQIPTECSYDVAGLALKARLWSSLQAESISHQTPRRRIIALHGWLDNCASFDGIAANVDADVLCLDLAGHGLSGGRQHLGAYNVWLDLPEILAIADQLGWQTFELLGHSRGAAIAFLLAATFPKRVERLVCLDGIFPLMGTAEKAPEQLFHSINTVRKQRLRPAHYYPTFEAAVAARQKGMFPLLLDDAIAFANRAVSKSASGYAWQYDPKVSAPSELRLTMAQLTAFADAIMCPLTLFIADKGILSGDEQVLTFLNNYPAWERRYLVGDHHCHMSAQANAIAQWLNNIDGIEI